MLLDHKLIIYIYIPQDQKPKLLDRFNPTTSNSALEKALMNTFYDEILLFQTVERTRLQYYTARDRPGTLDM